MRFQCEIEIDDEHLQVLVDYHNGYSLDSEYFEMTGRQDVENEMYMYLEGGFYQHYPLSPTPLGQFVLDKYLKNKTNEGKDRDCHVQH